LIGGIITGVGLIAIGIVGMLSRRWTVEVRQKWYDRHRWWPRPPAWYEEAIHFQVSLVALACGIIVIVGCLLASLL